MNEVFKNTLFKYAASLPNDGARTLDLGCSNGDTLFDIYEQFADWQFGELKGINIPEDKFNKYYPSIFDDWQSTINPPHAGNLYSEYMSQEWRKKLTKDVFSYDEVLAKEYVATSKERFDLVIMSDLLHLLPPIEVRYIIKHSRKLLRPNGVLFVIMANEEHRNEQLFKTIFNDIVLTWFRIQFKCIEKKEQGGKTCLVLTTKSN